MKKVLIYPFGKESEYIVEYAELLVELEIQCLVSMKGWGYQNGLYCVNDNRIPLGYDFEEAIKDYDIGVVWFTELHKNLDFEKDYLPYLRLAINMNKKLILDESIKEIAEKHILNISSHYLENPLKKLQKREVGEFLKQINTPLIYISSIYAGLFKSELQLMICKELKKRKLSFVQIGSKNVLSQFGFYDISEIVNDKTLSETKRTMMLNWCLKEIEEKEKPDLIIVGIPGEMTISTTQYVANFGYLARNYFMAAIPDILLMNIPYAKYTKKDLLDLSSFTNARFGVPVDVFGLTNKLYLEFDTEIEQKYTYLGLLEEDTEIVEYQDLLYKICESGAEKIVDVIIRKLNKYASIKSI